MRRSARISARKGILLDQDETLSKDSIVTPLKKRGDQEEEASSSTKQGRPKRIVERNIREEGLTEVSSDNKEVLVTGILLDEDENVSKDFVVTPLKKGAHQKKEASLSTKQGRSSKKVERGIGEKGVPEELSDNKEDIITGILLDQEENISKDSIVTPLKKGADQGKETSTSTQQGRPRRKVESSVREKGVTEESSDNKEDLALGKFTKYDSSSLESPAEEEDEPTTILNQSKKRRGRNVSIPSKASDYKRRTRSTSQCNNDKFVATNKEIESTGRKDITLNEQVTVSEPSKLPSEGLNASATQSFDILSDGKIKCITDSLKEPLRVILEDCGSLAVTKNRESQPDGLKTIELVKTTNIRKDFDTDDDQNALILEDSTTAIVPLDPIQSSNQKKPFVTKVGERQPDYEEILEEVKTANVSKDCDINNSEYTRTLSEVETSCQIPAGTNKSHENLKPNNNDLSTLGLSSKEGFKVTTKDSLKKFEKIKILNKDKVKQGLLFSKKSSKDKSLLKLTSDAFESFPFKITKKDLLDTNLPGKFITKTSKDFVDKLEHIPLTSDEKVDNVQKEKQFTLSSELDPHIDLNDLYFEIKGSKAGPVQRKASYTECEKKKDILKKSGLGPAFEKQEKSQARKTATQVIKQRRKEKEQTAGPGWYNLPKTEMTEETKRDMQVLKMRHLLNPKRFYKRGINKFPKYVFEFPFAFLMIKLFLIN